MMSNCATQWNYLKMHGPHSWDPSKVTVKIVHIALDLYLNFGKTIY